MSKKKKKQLLKGHKRIGKRFIPPMKQIPSMNQVSYIDNILPELIWIGLINEKVGYIRGTRILEKIFSTIDEFKEPEQHSSFALISSFNSLSLYQKECLAEVLDQDGFLEIVRNSIAPLNLLYENCPLLFLGPPTEQYSSEELIATMKNCVGKVIDKYETPGIVLNGSILLSRLVTRKIKFPADMDLPDFNAVINSPDSDDAKRAAAFMRSNALMEFGMHKVDTSWAQYFWNRGYELSPCDFQSK